MANFIHPPWAVKFYCLEFSEPSSEGDKEKPV